MSDSKLIKGYVNPVNDWLVVYEYYDDHEIKGYFENTNIFDILPLLSNKNHYTFYTKQSMVGMANILKDNHEDLTQYNPFKKITINASVITVDSSYNNSVEFDPKVLRENGVVVKGSEWTKVDKIDSIKNKLSHNELNALKAKVIIDHNAK